MWTQEQSIRAEQKTERSGPKSQMTGTEWESEKNERNAERDVAEWERSGERAESAKQPAPLRSNALHRSNRVSAEKIVSYIFVLIVYSHKVQL